MFVSACVCVPTCVCACGKPQYKWCGALGSECRRRRKFNIHAAEAHRGFLCMMEGWSEQPLLGETELTSNNVRCILMILVRYCCTGATYTWQKLRHIIFVGRLCCLICMVINCCRKTWVAAYHDCQNWLCSCVRACLLHEYVITLHACSLPLSLSTSLPLAH